MKTEEETREADPRIQVSMQITAQGNGEGLAWALSGESRSPDSSKNKVENKVRDSSWPKKS